MSRDTPDRPVSPGPAAATAPPASPSRRQGLGGLLGLAGAAMSPWRAGLQQVSRQVCQFGTPAAPLAAAAAVWTPGTAGAEAAEPVLAKLRARGTLRVGVYRDFPPFYDEGRGIVVDLAERLAQALGVKAELMPFPADESVDDDLRNMVWKGHYLGYGPADVLLQVPVDAKVIADNPQVRVFAPFYREGLAIARDLDALPSLDSLGPLAGRRVGVETASLAAFVMLGAEGGRYRDTVAVFRSPREAVAELKAGKLAAVVGLRSELEAMTGDSPRLGLSPVPVPSGQREWALGLAVKKAEATLARELQAAVNALAGPPMRELFGRHGVRHRPA